MKTVYVTLLVILLLPVAFALGERDPKTSVTLTASVGIQRLVTDMCTDAQTGVKFNFRLDSAYCTKPTDKGIGYSFTTQVNKDGKTTTQGQAKNSPSTCKTANLYQTVCNPCPNNRDNLPPTAGTGFCCKGKLISNPPVCGICEKKEYTCNGQVAVCKKETDGTDCGSGKKCGNGQCLCPSGKTDCSGTCVDTLTDNNNCGKCGIRCQGTTSCKGGLCKTACPDNDNDGYGIGDLMQCEKKVADCDDTNPNINPGIIEQGNFCNDKKDNNCNGDIDYDGTGISGKKGDAGCPVGVTGITVSTDKPIENSNVVVKCASTVTNVNSVTAKIDNILCSYTNWESLNVVFSCNVGAFTGNLKTIVCSIDTTKSTKTGTDQTKQITLVPSDCSKFTSTAACNADSRCSWCDVCSGKKYSGRPDGCVAKGSCSYTCTKDKCYATCDPTRGGWTNYPCDNICQRPAPIVGGTLIIRQDVTNSCKDDCTPTTNACCDPAKGECQKQSCGRNVCDVGKHLTGSCYNSCNDDTNPSDGKDATCGTCTPTCTCAEGYANLNDNMNDGCECKIAAESCDGKDNNCNGQTDDGNLCEAGSACQNGQCVRIAPLEFVFDVNRKIEDSGDWLLEAECTSDAPAEKGSATFTIPFGRLVIQNPTMMKSSIKQGEITQYAIEVECQGGECVNVQAQAKSEPKSANPTGSYLFIDKIMGWLGR